LVVNTPLSPSQRPLRASLRASATLLIDGCPRNLTGDCRPPTLTCLQPWHRPSRTGDQHRVRCLSENNARWRSGGEESRPSDATRRSWENRARTRGAEQCWLLKAERGGYSDGLCRTYAPMLPVHHTISRPHSRVLHSFRETLRFIVITVISAMSGTFPNAYGVFYMTVNSWRVRGPSCQRHGERHGEIGLGKSLPRYHDGDDAHDDESRAYSTWGHISTLRANSTWRRDKPKPVPWQTAVACSATTWRVESPVCNRRAEVT
jgi:hypothetical protein